MIIVKFNGTIPWFLVSAPPENIDFITFASPKGEFAQGLHKRWAPEQSEQEFHLHEEFTAQF